MRFSILALVATIAAVARAQSEYYPFKPNGPCVESCLTTIGKKLFSDFTDDPTNPNFMASLAYAHDRGTPKYTAYMSETGPCIGKCPMDEQNFYNSEYDAKNAWYVAHKNANSTTTSAATGGATTAISTGSPSDAASSPAAPTATKAPSGAAASAAASGLVGAAALLSAIALF